MQYSNFEQRVLLWKLTASVLIQLEWSSLYLIIKVYVVNHCSYMNVILKGGPGTRILYILLHLRYINCLS